MNAAKLTKKYMMLIVLILLIVFFSIFGENFLSVENAITVCRQVSIIGICATGMMCLSCIFTFSKGAWGGLAVAVVIFAIFLDRRLIALMGVAGVGALLAIPSIANRITYLFTADYLAASRRAGRVIRWSKGLKLLQESNPVLGFGLGRFGGAVAMQNKVIEETKDFSYFYMDNYYLKTLVEMGYLGLQCLRFPFRWGS